LLLSLKKVEEEINTLYNPFIIPEGCDAADGVVIVGLFCFFIASENRNTFTSSTRFLKQFGIETGHQGVIITLTNSLCLAKEGGGGGGGGSKSGLGVAIGVERDCRGDLKGVTCWYVLGSPLKQGFSFGEGSDQKPGLSFGEGYELDQKPVGVEVGTWEL
jgi:hypothetical protein